MFLKVTAHLANQQPVEPIDNKTITSFSISYACLPDTETSGGEFDDNWARYSRPIGMDILLCYNKYELTCYSSMFKHSRRFSLEAAVISRSDAQYCRRCDRQYDDLRRD